MTPHFMNDPAISPDGETICFSYMGDLWTVPFAGGEAKQLTNTNAQEWGPIYSPDGTTIAFQSNREGQSYIYTMPANGGDAEVIFRESLALCDWFSDSGSLLVVKNRVGKDDDFLRLYLNHSRPVEIAGLGDSYASISPKGDKIIFNRRGYPYREAYKGSVNGDLWEYDVNKKAYTQLTNTDYTERYPVYSIANPFVYYCASDGKTFQIVRAENGNFQSPVTISKFTNWSARDLSIARDNDRIVFEYFDQIWRYDPTKLLGERLEQVPILINQDRYIDFNEKEAVTSRFDQFAVSQDGKIVAFTYKYDLFLMPEKGGEVKQVTKHQPGIKSFTFLPDGRSLLFSAYEAGKPTLFKTSVDKPDKVEKVAWGSNKVIENLYSGPDDQPIVQYGNGIQNGRIAIGDSLGLTYTEVISDTTCSSNFIIHPKLPYALFIISNPLQNWNRSLMLYNLKTKEVREILSVDGYINNLQWGKDGNSVFFTKGAKLTRLDLTPRSEFLYDKDNWKEILATPQAKPEKETKVKEAKKSEPVVPETLNIDWKLLSERVKPIVSRSGRSWVLSVVDDSTLYYFNELGDKSSIYRCNYEGENEELLASIDNDIDYYDYIPDLTTLYYNDNELLKKVDLKTGKKGVINNHFDYQYNRLTLNQRVFDQAWGEFGKNFYDVKMHGVDWDSLYQKYVPYMNYAYSTAIMGSIVEEMVGEVNASHTGFYPRQDDKSTYRPTAYIGAEFDYSNNLATGITFQKVYRNAAISDTWKVKPGDILLAVDGINITASTPVDSLFLDKADKKIRLSVKQGEQIKQIEVKGLSYSAQNDLYYENWVAERSDLVAKLSNGKVGYLHIHAMSNEDYPKFLEDMFVRNADKKSIIIDVRGNSGGRIHEQLLEILTKKTYGETTNRYYNARYKTPENVVEKPLVVLVDQDSFSDGEIFPILFSSLKLGKVIGMPSSGSVIGTWDTTLMDGSRMRMPTSGWYLPDGTNMEGTGAQPDIRVDLTPEQIISDDDAQIKRAVKELLGE